MSGCARGRGDRAPRCPVGCSALLCRGHAPGRSGTAGKRACGAELSWAPWQEAGGPRASNIGGLQVTGALLQRSPLPPAKPIFSADPAADLCEKRGVEGTRTHPNPSHVPVSAAAACRSRKPPSQQPPSFSEPKALLLGSPSIPAETLPW